MMSGGRHKKEIKRRTKTGCLTCRKRRIKCDEAHPTCRNCQKSKRECMGYDPIFKQQPGPAQIQPAPSAAPLATSTPASAPPAQAPYAHVPQGYAPAASAGYAPPIAASGPGPHPSYDSFNSAIDPALAAADPAAMQGAPAPYNSAQALPPALRAGLGSASPYSSAASDGQPLKAKRIKIDDLFPYGGHSPPEVPARTNPITSELDAEITNVYTKDYCPGLDAILESTWFATNDNGLNRMMGDKALHEEAAHFVETCKFYNNQMYDGMSRIPSQEARLIWHMLRVCRQSPPTSNGTNGTTPAKEEDDSLSLKEVRARLDILEALLTNQNLDSNSLIQLPYSVGISELKKAEIEFWEHLGNFVMFADNESAPVGAVDRALGAMRGLLQQIEARDVLYSIAIARISGGRVPGFPNSIPTPVNNNPNDEINKLNIAMRFIQDEAKASTQQVITRICDMALSSWIVGR